MGSLGDLPSLWGRPRPLSLMGAIVAGPPLSADRLRWLDRQADDLLPCRHCGEDSLLLTFWSGVDDPTSQLCGACGATLWAAS